MLSESFKPRFLETDALGHINNTIIPQWFEGARDPIFRWFTPDLDTNNWKLMVAKYDINFHAELFYQNEVEIRTYISRIGNSSFDIYQEIWQHAECCVSGTAVLVHYDHSAKKSVALSDATRLIMAEHSYPG